MPDYRYLVLDSYPLSNAAIAPARSGTPNHSQQCQQWMDDCEAAGKILLVPAIAYYESVRDMFQRRATAQIARFQKYCFDPARHIPLNADHLTEAAKLWGALRRSGVPTSDPKALDGDAILAAQVLGLSLPTSQFVVVTRNPDHLARFGLPVEHWENITP